MTAISEKPVFGTYDKQENQVTAALMKILEVADYSLLNHLLQDAGDYRLPNHSLSIETQLKEKDGASVPDARLSCHCSFEIDIESKLRTDIRKEQLTNHLDLVHKEGRRLLYITGHDYRPDLLTPEVLWTSWVNVMDGLRDYQEKQKESNQVLDYLIDQFELLLTDLKLYDADKETRVIIVGGRVGEPIAQKYNFYFCQHNRFFKPASYLAFAWQNRIKYIYKILEMKKVDDMSECTEVTEEYFEKEEPGYKECPEKRTFFSLKLYHKFEDGEEIQNDSKDKNDSRCAFTQKQAYCDIETIMNAKHTSDLKKKGKRGS